MHVNSVADFLKRSADRNGFIRDRFEEKKIPTDFSNICILPFFGDMRGMFALSTFLFHRFREEMRGSKYFIIASWPGYQGLFPQADEYWSFNDEAVIKRFYEHSESFRNKSEFNTAYTRNMNEFFRDVITSDDLQKYYKNTFTNSFFDHFGSVKRYLPFIPSASILGKDFNRDLATRSGYKVFIHPSIYSKVWNCGMSQNRKTKRDFWIELCLALSNHRMTPVVWQNFNSYDISDELKDKCIFLNEPDVIKALAAMRASGCVLDVFNNLSRYAILARTPFLACDERSRYNGLRENEIDDLCAKKIPRKYIFTFSTIITDGSVTHWNQDIFQSIIQKLDVFLPELNRDELPSTAESNDLLSYGDLVRVRKKKKYGTRFIRVEKD
jgi:hypothetical protein